MRPVNLIPTEERRDRAAIRTGPVAYLLVGALTLALGAVTLVVLTNNKISDSKAKITQLKQQEEAAKVRADALAPFADFKSVEQSRAATVKSLADSRFDWERVMRELSRVIPGDVWLTGLTGTVAGASATSSSTTSSSTSSTSIDTSSITGPTLQLSGCARGQDAVASLLSALREIDGVTRVALASSQLPDSSSGSSGSSSSGSAPSGSSGSTGCTVRNFLAQFQIVAAFDAVPAPAIPQAAPSTTAPPTSSGTSTPTTPASDTSGTAPTG